VLLATQTAVLEAAADPSGRWVPSVPVISVEPRDGDSVASIWAIAAVLASPMASAWAAATYLGAGLGPTAIKLSAAQVLTLPWPAGSVEEAAGRLQAGDVDGAAQAALASYGLAEGERDAVWAWWQQRRPARRLGTRRRVSAIRPRPAPVTRG
jgi:hypothetical protein